MLHQQCTIKISRTYDHMLTMIAYGSDGFQIYGSAEEFGKLLYRMGESCVVYTDLDLMRGGKVVDPESIAYDIWLAMAAAHGNGKRGRKPANGVFLVNGTTGELIKHFRWGA
jgi:hypothetical protein